MNTKFSKYIPKFDENCNKYSRGHVAIFAGSVEYPGAAVLCSKAAARSGVGYVELFTPEPLQKDIALKLESVVVRPLNVDENFNLDKSCIKNCVFKKLDSILIGPGFSTGKAQSKLLKHLLDVDAPLIIDADAITIFATAISDNVTYKKIINHKKPIILTPHAGELKHLLAYASTDNINNWTKDKLVNEVQTWIRKNNLYNVVVIAKGPDTTVICNDAYNTCTLGTSTLATAGTGDVLAGCVASFMAQARPQSTAESLNVCSAAVETHGLAGEISALTFGKHGVMAGDVADALGVAIDTLVI